MANFSKAILTSKGQQLQAKVQSGIKLNFTKMALGNGNVGDTPISTLTDLISKKAEITITSGKLKNNTYTVGALFSNSILQTGFWWKEFGVYALDPDAGEILYCYSTAGDAGDYIPVASSQRIEKYIYTSIGVGNATNVTISVSQSDTYVTVTDFNTEMATKADLGADGKLLESQRPEINLSAGNITITDAAGNFTSTNVEGALGECFQYANDGKTAIRNAISAKGVTVSLEDTFTLLASKIAAQMCKFGGTATVTDVLTGKTFINNGGEILTGTMANQGAKNASLNAGGSYTIPAGYHNGNGVISANNLAGQTVGTAAAANILSGYTAWVGGIKITGTMTNNGAIASTLTTQGGQYTIPAGYHNGSGKVTANISNLTAENIKNGVNVGGVAGTFKGGTPIKSVQTITSNANSAYYGTSFTINPVNVDSTIIFFSAEYMTNGSSGGGMSVQLQSSTNIYMKAEHNYQYYIFMQIMEFEPTLVKSKIIVDCAIDMVNLETDYIVNFAHSVDISKCIIACTKTDDTGSKNWSPFGIAFGNNIAPKFSNTGITFRRNTNGYTTKINVRYEILEFY